MIFDLDLAMEVLARTPQALDALLRNLPDSLTGSHEGPGSFSPFDVVGHLIDGEETDWMVRAAIILAQGPDPRFTPYDRFRHQERNLGRDLDSLLTEFTQLRRANLVTLRSWNLTPDQLGLEGIHPTFGKVTLSQLLAAWVVHDLGHVAQVSRVMAKQYRGAVGPWTPFLPVLTDHEMPRS